MQKSVEEKYESQKNGRNRTVQQQASRESEAVGCEQTFQLEATRA